MNKREENELTKAIADNNARIIDPAYGSSTPVAPRSVIILFIALLFGLATPFGIIYLMEILDTTIRGRKDIEDKLSIPFLGDIPEYHGSTRQGSVVVRDNGRENTFSTDFLKFKELRIDYQLPKHLMAKTRFLQGASIGFFATNLFCITDWPQFDPEAAGLVNGTNIYPGIETVTFPMTRTYGINIKLQF